MAVSGRAGLFTMDEGPFFNDLRGTPYTAEKRQKSGALRIEFGKFNIPAGMQFVSTRVTINTGIMTVLTPTVVPNVPVTALTSGYCAIATSGSFQSGFFTVQIVQNGQFSGVYNNTDVNYMVIGY